MKKYKQITHLQELQQKLDKTYGKGLYKAGFVLLLFSCLFFTSCVPDSRSTMPTGRQEIPASSSEQEPSSSSNTSSRSSSSSSNTSSSSSTSSEARIKITDPNQTNSPNNLYGSDPAVLDAYFAREDKTSGTYKRIKSAAIGDTVFIVVDTANLSSRTIKVTIKDEKQIIKTEKIPFLQYKIKGDNTFEETPIDVSGEFSTKVRNDKRFALYKIVLKAKEDETTKKWKDEINKHTDKKLKLCLTVTVEGEEVIYCGSNFAKEEQRAKDKESNVWLNMDKKWFEVVIDCFCSKLKIDSEGFIFGGEVIKNKIESCNNGDSMSEVKIIVLHRTAGGAASGTLSHMSTAKYGAHFVIDNASNTDGKAYHAISINKRGTHMGKGQYQITKDNDWGNHNSIGIEVCGYSYTSDGKKRVGANGTQPHAYWQEVTEKQAKSLACLVKFLLEHYNLTLDAVKCHEDLCAKEPNEGKDVYNAMKKYWHLK